MNVTTTESLTQRVQVRLTEKQMEELRQHTRVMGFKPGTLLRHLALAWLAERRAGGKS